MEKEVGFLERATPVVIQSEYQGDRIYGIRFSDEKGQVLEFAYLSAIRQDAVRLVRRLSSAKISAAHFEDVVADYLKELFFERLVLNGISVYKA